MKDCRQFYIDGQWVDPMQANDFPVENPSTEEQVAVITLGTAEDVDKAVAAARRAFDSFGFSSREERIELLEKLLAVYKERYDEMAEAISVEMGAPVDFAAADQADCGRGHIATALKALKSFEFEHQSANARIVKEPVGVCGFITPWNWPINQIACKVAPALATGCTMVLKPSEIAPLSAHVFSDMIHQAGFPAGVYNMIHGDGPGVGAAISSHRDIDMVSFTGSTRAGTAISRAAADTVKRVALELGGKSPNIIFDDTDLEKAVTRGVVHCMDNVGQSCNAPTRMLVPADRYEEAVEIAARAANEVKVGKSDQHGDHIGPLVSRPHFEKVQGMIQAAIEEGARVAAGGPGKPEGLETGYFTKPTVFADVNNKMNIAREEVFGPVLAMIPYQTEEEAIEIANDTPYGLAAYVQSDDEERVARVTRRLRAGMVRVNGAPHIYSSPFGGYKQSGNGREWGEYGFDDFLETKAISQPMG
ncbi:aldehyde dehydrogenase family protein [Pseudomaricurvus alkylphenolicus]|uniref:aldehyde dehydrogenase family protein n=1 Tax=Pseudomaricurvus alkylphenolicus TaxID=1306991 RepID=UPI00141E2FFE|nr:aldehyde dehydrogenase family protein [Pseudomaricurvus alkylphenolicus]NIB39435.1 aldehyde dehydrogenase family protein [Pseudomaricurvus alkylphenolicus]